MSYFLAPLLNDDQMCVESDGSIDKETCRNIDSNILVSISILVETLIFTDSLSCDTKIMNKIQFLRCN